MGDRVSIQFVQEVTDWNDDEKKTTDKSVVLFHHWGGEWFPKLAEQWVVNHNKDLAEDRRNSWSDPISRMDVHNLLLQFIRFLSLQSELSSTWASEIIDGNVLRNNNYFTGSLYLGADENSGDNSDNGHFEIKVPEPLVYKLKEKKNVR
jgi:hypothetical protein